MTSSWAVWRFAASAAASAMLRRRVLNCLWELTYRCNARCAICPYWRREGPAPAELTTEEVEAGLELLHHHGLRAVNFTGGEPLLRPDLEAIIATASRLGIWSSVVTNGSLLTPPRLTALRAAGLDNLMISVDSPDAAIHDGHRGIPGLWEQVNGMLERLGREFLSGHRTGGVLCTLARHNAGDLEAMVALAQRHGVYLALQPYHEKKTGDVSHTAPLPEAALARLRAEARSRGVLLNSSRYLDGLLRRAPAHCAAGRKYFSIDPFGRVHACVDQPVAGHLFGEGLAALATEEVRRSVANCPGCWYCFRGEADSTLSPGGYWEKARLAWRVLRHNRGHGAPAVHGEAWSPVARS
jgi:MoaA/NifB/PqqE/SkfB family radical SAM enzyme